MKRRRGPFGRPQVGLRRLREEASRELGIDPAALPGREAARTNEKDLYKGMVRRLIQRAKRND
ncbi:MAG TPA: hypothetical protein VK008_00015 [Sphingobacteriaceae bacterium]|nr:hypothetical protein [Sphingobacteriaceae bacterium]